MHLLLKIGPLRIYRDTMTEIKSLSEGINGDPFNPDLRLKRMIAFFESDKWEEFVAEFTFIHEYYPDMILKENPEYQKVLANNYFINGDYRSASDIFKELYIEGFMLDENLKIYVNFLTLRDRPESCMFNPDTWISNYLVDESKSIKIPEKKKGFFSRLRR